MANFTLFKVNSLIKCYSTKNKLHLRHFLSSFISVWSCLRVPRRMFINPFHITGLFLHSLKTSDIKGLTHVETTDLLLRRTDNSSVLAKTFVIRRLSWYVREKLKFNATEKILTRFILLAVFEFSYLLALDSRK